MVWRKNSGKNSKCSSDWDLSVESSNVKFSALENVVSRVYRDIFRIQIAFFCTLKVVSGEWYGDEILEKIPSVPLD